MTAQASQGLAHRLGYSLGRFVGEALSGKSFMVRLSKRFAAFAVIAVLAIKFGGWILGVLLTIGLLTALVAVVAQTGTSRADYFAVEERFSGHDVYGRKLDSWGNVESEWPDQDQ